MAVHYVEVDLEDFTDEELWEEVTGRGSEPYDAMAFLRSCGVPPALLDPIEAWFRSPVADANRLKEWSKWAQNSPANTTG